jgi:hypothetical protein
LASTESEPSDRVSLARLITLQLLQIPIGGPAIPHGIGVEILRLKNQVSDCRLVYLHAILAMLIRRSVTQILDSSNE